MPIQHVQGIDLHYQIEGSGEPVLFIHGLGSSTLDWQPQVEALCGRFKTVTFDVRGHGRSSKPLGRYSIPQFAADTAALMRSLEIGPAHIVGLSMGGMIAFELALQHPGLVRSLVIANSAPEFVLRPWRERLLWLERRLVVRLLGMRKIGALLGARLLPKPEQQGLRQGFVARWAQNDRRAYAASMRALVGWSVAARLHEIKCPVLVIAADEDYTPIAAKQAYVSQMPQAELVVIEDSRHLTPVERPEAFNTALLAFLTATQSLRRG